MKKFSLLALFIAPLWVIAQQTEGVVTYIETIQFKIEPPEGIDVEEFRKMMPSEQKSRKVLYFNAKECLYTDAPDQAPGGHEATFSSNDGDGDVRMDFKIQRPENHQWRQVAEGQRVESLEFFGRFFLIKETPKKMKWKISAEQKQVAGHLCQKAVLQDTSRQVEAWFCPQIPLAVGPGEYADLPGLILAIDMDKGTRTVVAEQVEFKAFGQKKARKSPPRANR
jgi:Protein of unknown function (Porph_ging).